MDNFPSEKKDLDGDNPVDAPKSSLAPENAAAQQQMHEVDLGIPDKTDPDNGFLNSPANPQPITQQPRAVTPAVPTENLGDPQIPNEVDPPSYSEVIGLQQSMGQQATSDVPLEIPHVPGTGILNNHLPGLENLRNLDRVSVVKEMSFAGASRYIIQDTTKQTMYSSVQLRFALAKLIVTDNHENEVMHLQYGYDRACICIPIFCCPIPIFLENAEVYSPPGCLIGSVRKTWNNCTVKFNVVDVYNNIVLKIETNSTFRPRMFQVTFVESSANVGSINNEWNLMREAFTGFARYDVSFSSNLDVKLKTLMVAAALVMDSANSRVRRHRSGFH